MAQVMQGVRCGQYARRSECLWNCDGKSVCGFI